MTDKIKIALAQINPKLGDVAGNVARIGRARAEAAAGGADLVLAPELHNGSLILNYLILV